MKENQEHITIPEMVEEVRAGKLPRRHFMKKLTAMGVSAGGVGIIATAAATRAFSAHQAPVVQADEEVARNIDRHKEHLRKQTQGDIDGLHNDYAHHAVVEDSMYSESFVGHQAILARKQMNAEAFSNLNIEVVNRVAQNQQVAVEWIASGIHNGGLPGFPASGRPFSIHGVTVVVRQNGKIVRESIYYDMNEVKRQFTMV